MCVITSSLGTFSVWKKCNFWEIFSQIFVLQSVHSSNPFECLHTIKPLNTEGTHSIHLEYDRQSIRNSYFTTEKPTRACICREWSRVVKFLQLVFINIVWTFEMCSLFSHATTQDINARNLLRIRIYLKMIISLFFREIRFSNARISISPALEWRL